LLPQELSLKPNQTQSLQRCKQHMQLVHPLVAEQVAELARVVLVDLADLISKKI
jgi:hypothetical protein